MTYSALVIFKYIAKNSRTARMSYGGAREEPRVGDGYWQRFSRNPLRAFGIPGVSQGAGSTTHLGGNVSTRGASVLFPPVMRVLKRCHVSIPKDT